MKQITAKFGIIHKAGFYNLFENGTVNIFNNECEVFSFETEVERDDYIVKNGIIIKDWEGAASGGEYNPEPDLPNETWLNAEIAQWLNNRGVATPSSWTKARLLEEVNNFLSNI